MFRRSGLTFVTPSRALFFIDGSRSFRIVYALHLHAFSLFRFTDFCNSVDVSTFLSLVVQTVELILQGQNVSPAEADRGRQSTLELRHRLESFMARNRLDAWIAPAATGPPPFGLGEAVCGLESQSLGCAKWLSVSRMLCGIRVRTCLLLLPYSWKEMCYRCFCWYFCPASQSWSKEGALFERGSLHFL